MDGNDHNLADFAVPTYLQVPEDLPIAIHMCDAQGRIQQVTRGWLDLFGYTRDEVVGRRSVDLLTPGSRAVLDIDQGTVAATDGWKTQTLQFLHKSGDPVTVDLSATLIPTEAGGMTGWISVVHRVAGQDALLDLLKLKSYRLKSCIEGTDAGTWEWNIQTGETRFNERWAEIIGYSLTDLAPVSIDTWLACAHPDDLERSQRALERHWAGETPFYDIEVRMRHRDGHWVWVHDRGRVFTWTSDGKPEWMFGTHFSIQKQKERELKAAHLMQLLDRTGTVAGVGGWELDLETNEVLWTAETRRIHGVADDYVPSLEDALDFYPDEVRAKLEATLEAALAEGTPWDLELPFIRKTGERIWVRAVGEVETRDGKARRLFGAFQDITARVRRDEELRTAREWTRLAAQSGGIGLWSLDVIEGSVTWDNQTARHFRLDPATPPQTLGDWLAALPVHSARRLKRTVQTAISSRAPFEVEIDFQGADGALIAVKITGQVHLDKDGLLDCIQGACYDLTRERQLMLDLQEQTSKMSVTLSSIGDGVITTDTDRKVTWINDVAERLTGWSLQEAVGQPSDVIFGTYHEDTGERTPDPVARCLKDRQVATLDPKSVLRRRDGTEIAVDDSAAPILDGQRNAIGAVLVFRDVTGQRQQARDVEYRASHDLLTGLLNRQEFERRLTTCLADPISRTGHYLFFVDLDHFKRVNDSFGHETGDHLLRKAGALLRKAAGSAATVGRRGGDEFVVLLKAASRDAAQRLGERICAKIADISVNRPDTNKRAGIGASIGIVDLGLSGGSISECLRRADIAAYSAKNAGRGQVCFWRDSDSSMQNAVRQMCIVEDIERANADGSWVVHAQSITPIKGPAGPAAMKELLIRMPGPDGGLIGPDQIVSAAERYGMMPMIDLWMGRYCVDLLARRAALGDNTVFALNLSATSVSSRSFQRDFLALLTQADPATLPRMCIEITETSVVENYETVSAFLTSVREHGVLVAIDDFGAGASSFRYFRELPADFVKIDGSFVRTLADPVSETSVECFIRMARVSGLQTIAEHVEEADMIGRLGDLGVDYVQGFAIDEPAALV